MIIYGLLAFSITCFCKSVASPYELCIRRFLCGWKLQRPKPGPTQGPTQLEGWFMALQASRDIDKSEPFHCELVEQPLKPLLIYMSAPCIACVYCVFSI